MKKILTRNSGQFELFIDNEWHSRSSWPEFCLYHSDTPLQYSILKESPTTFMSYCPKCDQWGDSSEVGFQLPTRVHKDKFQVHIDGRWRSRKDLDQFCFGCWRKTNTDIAYDYYGAVNDNGTIRFWAVCPRCGFESSPSSIGLRSVCPKQPKEPGWLRSRRSNSGY